MERFAIKIDKKLKANLYKICRLCGMVNPDMIPIISEQQTDKNENDSIDVEAEMDMQQKINLLLGLSITKDDKMPQTMCCLCVDKINDFYEFREMCYATNAQTRKLLGLKNIIKKPAFDMKPKVEIKEESIVPTPFSAPTYATNKNGNRKRKTDELTLKEETIETSVVLSKKKLRFSLPAESTVKEETPVQTKKKLRFTAMIEQPQPELASSSKKSKNNAVEDSKLKKESSPPMTVPPPAVSNKKLRLAVLPQKDLSTKKSKQKAAKNAEQKEPDVKEEIKEEIKEESAAPVASTLPIVKIAPAPKLKFGCNICKERFPAKVNLDAHTRTTHIPKIERYVCTACNEVLSKSFDIKNHQLWHKLSKTPYVCGCCGESILNTYAFSRHLREHAFETPPALQVLDRECPQCHTSYATNFLYNIHICAVKTKRCAGCNRIQRNDTEYLKHSAQCAKVYLNYSKHIMPSVEALEDAVRIKNENDVEAAAEEMARLSGVPLDMAPVVQLTRLSSPLIMAASHCVSTTSLDDAASTSSKKSGKKGVSKKDLKRVDELLKSTLDALVSIKHEPEVHVDQEALCASELSDNDDHIHADDHAGGMDDDTDNENEANSSTTAVGVAIESGLEQIKIKQEIDETNEENSNKIGGGLKLKIKKEHGQLNSSIIEQQKSSEKRAEKRKKKKKHKEKEKDKQKLSKDVQDEQLSQDSIANNNNSETNFGTTIIRIKTEPQDATEGVEKSVAPVLQTRPQPEATIMTSIPMMQFQIACVSSGVEFNNATSTVSETHQTISSANHDDEPEDVKPNREELDRMLKISHVSSGVDMERCETEESDVRPMDYDENYDKGNSSYDDEDFYHEQSNEVDQHGDASVSEHEEGGNVEEKSCEDTGVTKKNKNPKLLIKQKDKSLATATKSRNKACKSTAKPPNMPILQISAVQSGIMLEGASISRSEFTPIFIKPEPQNRGYSDEQPAATDVPSHPQPEYTETQDETEELATTYSAEEQNYISSIDFNNITIKQEKDIEINDVQITQKSVKPFAKFNGIKRKRKQVSVSRSDSTKDKTSEMNDEDEVVEDEEQETDEDDEEENDDEETEEEEEEEDEEDDEEIDADEDEEREYRELEYPPKLGEEKTEVGTGEVNKKTNDNNEPLDGNTAYCQKENINDSPNEVNSNISFVIANVCSHAMTAIPDVKSSIKNDDNMDNKEALVAHDNSVLTSANVSGTEDFELIPSSLPLSSQLDSLEVLENPDKHLSSYYNSDISSATTTEISIATGSQPDLNTTITSYLSQSENTHPVQQMPSSNGMSTAALNFSKTPHISDSSLQSSQETQNSEETNLQCLVQNTEKNSVQSPKPDTQNLQADHISEASQQQQYKSKGEDIELSRGTLSQDYQKNSANILPCTITGAPINCEYEQDSTYHQQYNLHNTAEHSQERRSSSPILLEKLPDTQDFEVKPHTSKILQQTLEISSVRTTALNVTPELKTYSLSNNDGHQISEDNQDETATIEGTIQQSKDVDLWAQSVTENVDNESVNNDENEDGENENELEDNNNDESTVGNNLEERQNYQNQEVLSQIRPTAALALHPYLEDISSSSNSLLSNSLSQTPPLPLQPRAATATSDDFKMQTQEQQRLLNTEETENILNESNDILSRRCLEVAQTSEIATGQLLSQPNLGQQLPPHMPTFNFDNINEIAENNNNANIEREQLQDELQQQQHQNQQQPTNNP